MSDENENYVRSPELLARDRSRLAIIDVQEKLLAAIPVRDKLVRNCRRLIDAARIVGVPIVGTEQYPQGLGPTAGELAERIGPMPGKVCFSGLSALGWKYAGEEERDQIVVAGMESHVCVLQTVFDLLSYGYRVYVPSDAVASRSKSDWKIAIGRMASAGATIITVEMALFEWCERAGSPEFKQIQKLIVES